VSKKQRIPLRARWASLTAATRRGWQAIPWQVWRTAASLVVLVAVWVGAAHACARIKARSASAPVVARPLVDSCRAAPEPYLD